MRTVDENPLAPERALAAPGFHQPLASGTSALHPGEKLSFRIAAFSSQGLELLVPAHGWVPTPGERLTVRLFLPMARPQQVEVEVRHAHLDEASGLRRVLVRWTRAVPHVLEAVGGFLLAHAGVSLLTLREAGLPLGDVEQVLSFGEASTEQELEEILALRYAAYRSKGKRLHVSGPEEMRDRFDALSRQVTCRINGTLVASARVTFNEGDLSRSEYVSYGVKLPGWVLEGGFVEVGRVVTHPGYLIALPIIESLQQHQPRQKVLSLSPSRRILLLGHRLSHPLVKRAWAWRQARRQRASLSRA